MEYKRLGHSGMKVSRIILGCMGFGNPSRGTQEWALGIDEARPIIKQALEAGITTLKKYNDSKHPTSPSFLWLFEAWLQERKKMNIVAGALVVPSQRNAV